MESPPASSDVDFAEFFDPSKPFQSIVICCTSIPPLERTDLSNKISELGGRHEYDLTPKTTHLIVGEHETTKYRHVAKQRPDIKPMAMGWIDAVRNFWVKDEPIDFRALERAFTLKTFETGGGALDHTGEIGLTNKLLCCISGLEEEERTGLITMIKANGGNYTGNLDKTCTHLIVREPSGRKYLAARRWEQRIVTKQWVMDSVRRGMILDEACYDPHLPPEDIGKGAWIKRDLRRKSLGKRLREAAEGQSEGGRRKLRKTASMKLNSQRENMWGEILGQQPSLDQSAVSLHTEPTQPLPSESMLRRPSEPTPRAGVVADSLAGVSNGGDDVFASCYFYLFDFSPQHVEVIVPFITSRGGRLSASAEELGKPRDASRCFVVVPQQSDPRSHPLVPSGVEIITEFFIEKCVFKKGTALPDPKAHVIGRPFPVFPINGFDQLSISTSGFVDIELNQVDKTVRQLGARYAERFTAQCSMLICTSWASARKQKLDLALSWGVPIVKAEWLWQCISQGKKLPIEDFMFPEARARRVDRAQLSKPLSRSKSVSDMPKKLAPKTLIARTGSTTRASLPSPDISAFDTTSLVATEPPHPASRRKGTTKELNPTPSFETAPTHQDQRKPVSQQQELPSRPGSRSGSQALVEKSANDLNKATRDQSPSKPTREPLARVRSEICDSEAGDDDGSYFAVDNDDAAASDLTRRDDPVEVEERRAEQVKAEKAAAERRSLSNKLTSLLEGTSTTTGAISFDSNVSAVGTEPAAAAATGGRRKRKIMGRVVSNASACSNGSEDESGSRGPLGRTRSAIIHEDDSLVDEEQAGPTATQIQYDDPEAARHKQRLMSKMLGRGGSLGSARSSVAEEKVTMAAMRDTTTTAGRNMRRR